MQTLNEFNANWKIFQDSEEAQRFKEKSLYHPELTKPSKEVHRNWEAIVAALVFWKFIRRCVKWEYEKNVVRQFLLQFIEGVPGGSERYMMLVAMIEFFPTSMWRKMLWNYNIDFMSFQSFMRRITEEQVGAIMENFMDLRAGVVPRVFSLWDRKIKKVTVEKLLAEYDDTNRYNTKGAMSYNLLDLDFGFNAFPKGVKDDTKIVEVSPFRFISEKQHADDFIVNQENGKYWRAYEKVRSNYVYRPNRKVKLSTHICPGFWYTLIMHALFWVISPLTALSVGGELISNGWSWSPMFLGAVLIGSFTSIWVLIALLKLSLKYGIIAIRYAAKYGAIAVRKLLTVLQMKKFVITSLKVFGASIGILILLAVSGFLAGALFTVSINSIVRTLLNAQIIYLFLHYAASGSEDTLIGFKKFDPRIQKIMKILTVISLVSLGIDYFAYILLAIYYVFFALSYAIMGIGYGVSWVGEIILYAFDWLKLSIPIGVEWLQSLVINIGIWFLASALPWFLSVIVGFAEWFAFSLIPWLGSVLLALVELVIYAAAGFGGFCLGAVVLTLFFVYFMKLVRYVAAQMKKVTATKQWKDGVITIGKHSNKIMIIGAVLAVAFFVYSSKNQISAGQQSGSLITSIAALFLILVAISSLLIWSKQFMLKSDERYKEISGRSMNFKGNTKRLWKASKKNKYLEYLSSKDRRLLFDRISNFVYVKGAFGFGEQNPVYENICATLYKHIWESRIIDELCALCQEERNIETSLMRIYVGGRLDEFLIEAKLIPVSKAFKQTIKLIEKEEADEYRKKSASYIKRQERKAKFKASLKVAWRAVTFIPAFMWSVFVSILNDIKWFFTKIIHGVQALYGFWILFQKRCPWVSHSKNLLSED